MAPTPLEEIATIHTVDSRTGTEFKKVLHGTVKNMQEVLTVLTEEGGVVIAKEKRAVSASTYIKEQCQVEKLRTMSSGGFMSILHKLEDGGWIKLTVNGKRIPSVELLHRVYVKDLTRRGEKKFETKEEPLDIAPEPVVEQPVHPEDEVDIGMRQGRLAARLEKQVPDLVREAVRTEFTEMIGGILGTLGFYQGVSPADYAKLDEEAESLRATEVRLQTQIERMMEEHQRYTAMVDWLTDQEDDRLAKSNDGFPATKEGLRPSQVPESYRRMAQHAIDNGWIIEEDTRKSPSGMA